MSDRENDNTIKDTRGYLLRITAALYRVTDLFDDAEPLKWSLRRQAMDLMDIVSVCTNEKESFHRRLQGIEDARRNIGGLREKLLLTQASGFISRINFEVLEREYMRVSHELLNRKPPMLNEKDAVSDISNGHIIKDTIDNKGHTELLAGGDYADSRDEVKKSLSSKQKTVAKGDRLSIIEAFLNGKGWLQVGDVSGAYENPVSIKTIQRDLHALVKRGSVKVTGNKRWRKYAKVD